MKGGKKDEKEKEVAKEVREQNKLHPDPTKDLNQKHSRIAPPPPSISKSEELRAINKDKIKSILFQFKTCDSALKNIEKLSAEEAEQALEKAYMAFEEAQKQM